VILTTPIYFFWRVFTDAGAIVSWLPLEFRHHREHVLLRNLVGAVAVVNELEHDFTSVSARISKGQGYQVFLRKRAGSSFGQKRAICVVLENLEKRDRISLLLGSIKCFPLSFDTFKTL
jgi:hypothetical protein